MYISKEIGAKDCSGDKYILIKIIPGGALTGEEVNYLHQHK